MPRRTRITDSAAAALLGSGFSGGYDIEIVSAISEISKNELEFISLVVKVPSRGNKIYRIRPQSLDMRDKVTGEIGDTFFKKQLDALMSLIGKKNQEWKLEQRVANVWDSDQEAFVDKLCYQFVDFIGIKIHAILSINMVYPNMPINGYSKIPVNKADKAAKNHPETIWIPDYDSDMRNEFNVEMFVTLNNHLSWHEVDTNKSEAKDYAKKLDYIVNRKQKEQLNDEQLDELAEKRLAKRLNSFNIEYNEDRVQKYSKYTEPMPKDF